MVKNWYNFSKFRNSNYITILLLDSFIILFFFVVSIFHLLQKWFVILLLLHVEWTLSHPWRWTSYWWHIYSYKFLRFHILVYHIFLKLGRQWSPQIHRIIRVLSVHWLVSSLVFFVALLVCGCSSRTYSIVDCNWEQLGVVEVYRCNTDLSIPADINEPINWSFGYLTLWKTSKRIFWNIDQSWSEHCP